MALSEIQKLKSPSMSSSNWNFENLKLLKTNF